ncbi:MAG: cytochrome C oxidase subunit IV family protein [Paracoccaceae bacterium]
MSAHPPHPITAAQRVTRAWIFLLILSAASTLLAVWGKDGPWLAVAVLVLAGIKARVILSAYLGLRDAPDWQRGFDLALGLLLVTLCGLAVAG